jgi:hypothetical protein
VGVSLAKSSDSQQLVCVVQYCIVTWPDITVKVKIGVSPNTQMILSSPPYLLCANTIMIIAEYACE